MRKRRANRNDGSPPLRRDRQPRSSQWGSSRFEEGPTCTLGLRKVFREGDCRGCAKINAKLHDGVCQRCKEVLEWRVKYSKYKPLSKPKKCVKCLQKTVKDSYHIMCRPCACKLEVCAKCGKEEEIVIPFNKEPEPSENTESEGSNHRRSCKRKEDSDEDLDAESDSEGEDEDSQA